MAKVTAATVITAATTAVAASLVHRWFPPNKIGTMAETAVAGVVLLVTYLVAATALRLSEAQQFAGAVVSKLRSTAGH